MCAIGWWEFAALRRESFATSSRSPGNACCGQSSPRSCLKAPRRPISSSCFGLVPEVGISRHECTQKQILCRVQSCPIRMRVNRRSSATFVAAGDLRARAAPQTRGVPGAGRDSACLRSARRANPPCQRSHPAGDKGRTNGSGQSGRPRCSLRSIGSIGSAVSFDF